MYYANDELAEILLKRGFSVKEYRDKKTFKKGLVKVIFDYTTIILYCNRQNDYNDYGLKEDDLKCFLYYTTLTSNDKQYFKKLFSISTFVNYKAIASYFEKDLEEISAMYAHERRAYGRRKQLFDRIVL